MSQLHLINAVTGKVDPLATMSEKATIKQDERAFDNQESLGLVTGG
jgi:hypothetical protein